VSDSICGETSHWNGAPARREVWLRENCRPAQPKVLERGNKLASRFLKDMYLHHHLAEDLGFWFCMPGGV
jgi:hypothetical protein